MCNTGTIVTWGGTLANIPAGWLYCNGMQVRQTAYPNLFSVIQFNYGANPPPGMFYLPDLRGRFIRGVDDGAGRDPDVAARTDMQNTALKSSGVGSIQSHAFQTHTHLYNSFPDGSGDIASGRYWKSGAQFTAPPDPSQFQVSSETRPFNAYLYYIIMT